MTISSEVQIRISSQRLIELTNNGDTSATTIDTTVLNAAIADVGADFKIKVGIVIDDTVDTHIVTAVKGVEYYLLDRVGVYGDVRDRVFDQYTDRLEALAKVTGRDRILPRTSSILTPSSESKNDGRPVRPDFDRPRFGPLVPDPPAAIDEDDFGR